MLKRTVLGVLLLMIALVVAACAGGTPANTPDGEAPLQPGDTLDDNLDDDLTDDLDGDGDDMSDDDTGDLPPVAVLEAQQMLAAQLGISADEISVVSTEQVNWPDACLGMADEGEMCAQVITPGWLIVFEVNGQQYEVHTDDLGQSIRFADS